MPRRASQRRQRRLRERLALSEPESGEARRRPGGDARRRKPPLEVRRLHRRQLRPQPLRIRSLGLRLADGGGTDPSAGVQHPRLVFRTPAEHLPGAARRTVRTAEEELHEPTLPARLPAHFHPGKGERPLDAHAVHLHRRPGIPFPLGENPRRRCLGGVERCRRHHPAEQPVLRPSAGVPLAELGLEGRLAVGKLLPDPEQRMAGIEAGAPRRLHPVPLTLERVRRERDPAAALSRMEPRESQVQPGLVGAGHRLREAGVRLQAREHHRGGRRGNRIPGRRRPRERRQRTEHRAGADLDEHPRAEPRERLHPGSEADRKARLPPPVAPVRIVPGRQDTARQVAYEGRGGRPPGERARGRLEVREHRIQQCAMERMTGP